MAASVFDSPLYAHLFPTGEMGRLFSDSAAIRAMLVVEGALAKAQGAIGMIPEISAAAIQRASLEIQIDPGALAPSTGQNGVCVPGLVTAFRAEMNAPEHAQFVHWGATSQDIIDTALMLRLRQALLLIEEDIKSVVKLLATNASNHADTPMIARTYGQQATPTTWGAVLAQWGMPLIDALDTLPTLRSESLWVSLSGASGTAQALGRDAFALRQELAKGLGLNDPERSWHTDRGPIIRITNWMAEINATLGAMGQTLCALSATEVGEVFFAAAGGSSTMPQKQNPIKATSLVSLATHSASLQTGMLSAAQHQHQRDGTTWFTEWMVLPQIVLGTASCLLQSKALLESLQANTERMDAALKAAPALYHAEALSFALCNEMSRPEAQSASKNLCEQAISTQSALPVLARAAYPDLPANLFDPKNQLGQAPEEARRFADRAKVI